MEFAAENSCLLRPDSHETSQPSCGADGKWGNNFPVDSSQSARNYSSASASLYSVHTVHTENELWKCKEVSTSFPAVPCPCLMMKQQLISSSYLVRSTPATRGRTLLLITDSSREMSECGTRWYSDPTGERGAAICPRVTDTCHASHMFYIGPVSARPCSLVQ